MALFCVGATVVAGAAAQALPDPTRPPAFLSEPERGAGKTEPGLQLQSILISPKRRVATIDGQSVHVGDRVGDGRVVKITENEVVLRNGKDVQSLKLFPQIEKQRESSHGSAKNSARNSGGSQ